MNWNDIPDAFVSKQTFARLALPVRTQNPRKEGSW